MILIWNSYLLLIFSKDNELSFKKFWTKLQKWNFIVLFEKEMNIPNLQFIIYILVYDWDDWNKADFVF